MRSVLQTLCALPLAVAALLPVPAVGADVWPSKTIRIVVPYAPGGIVDVRARQIAERLSRNVGQAVLVENRPGASTIVGVDAVAKSAPDGHTILIISANTFINLPLLMQRLPYDPVKDLTPVTQYSSTPYLVLVHPSLGVKTFKEFVALAKSKPGKLTYSSAGSGTFVNIAGEMVKHAAGLDIVHVPYKGDGPALTDAVAGHVDMTIGFAVTAGEFIKSGRLIPLMQSGPRRLRVLADVPTAQEVGYVELAVVPFGGFWAPSKTPAQVVGRVNTELVKVFRSEEFQKIMDDSGSEIHYGTPEEFAAHLASERARWADIIKKTGVKIEQ